MVHDGYGAPDPGRRGLGSEQVEARALRNLADSSTNFPTSSAGSRSHGLAGVNALNLRSLGVNRTLIQANIELVGMPKWTPDERASTKHVQEALGRKVEPLLDKVDPVRGDREELVPTGGGSDDIGDIMWTVPAITIRFQLNIPNMIGHSVTSAIAMAPPIAHMGAVAGAKAVALTVLDLMTSPEDLAKAKKFFNEDLQKYDRCKPFLAATDVSAIHINDDYMRTCRPPMEPYYYDSTKYPSYLDRLGIKFPSGPTGPIRKIVPPKQFTTPTDATSSGGG